MSQRNGSRHQWEDESEKLISVQLESQDQSPIHQINLVSYDQVLSKIGLGRYQYVFFVILVIIGITEGSQITVFTLMMPIIKNEWKVSDDLNSLQTSLIFVGFFIGCMISGIVSDRLGRRVPFIFSLASTILVCMLTSVVRNIYQLILLRFMLGILVGFFGPLSITLVAEITPKEVRGKFMSLIQISISIGQLFGLFVGYVTLESLSEGDWRSLVFWTSFPGLLALIGTVFWVLESPMFVLNQLDLDQTVLILDQMNERNGKKIFEKVDEATREGLRNWVLSNQQKRQQQAQASENGSVRELLGPKYFSITLILWYNWFVLSFIYYGILILLPMILEANRKSDNDFLKLTVSNFSEMLAAAIAATLIDLKYFGRKNSMIIFQLVSSVFSLWTYLSDEGSFIFLSLLSKFFLTMTFVFSYQFTAEVYPTQIRTTGIGIAQGIGRFGGATMPWICIALMNLSTFLPFLLFSLMSLSLSILNIFLPFDTLGRDLDT